MSDEYCFAGHCQYRHWQSGSMPTHRKGEGCPKEYTPSTEEVRDVFASDEFGELKDRWAEEFDRWHQGELRRAKAEAWEVCASVAEELIEDGIRPADAEEHLRNPYREDAYDHP